MITDDICPARRIREEYAESWWVIKHNRNALGTLKGICSLLCHAKLDEGEFGKDFQILNHAKF
jgi:hypothetical protein